MRILIGTKERLFSSLIKFVLVGFLSFLSAPSYALGDDRYIGFDAADNYELLVDSSQQLTIVVDENDAKGVKRAATVFSSDLEKVTGKAGRVINHEPSGANNVVVLGTIGNSRFIDDLVRRQLIDVGELTGQWDGYLVQRVEKPFSGVSSALVVVGSNKRGTIFGTYDISEQMGVSPWYFWADVPITRRDALYVKRDVKIQEIPKIKYRGIFLNDEAPALTNWVQENYGNYNHSFYEHVFELLQRLKANFLWPAMWNNAFADDDPKNLELADEYGIVMSTSHHEPMMRADKEWNRYGEGEWDYAENPKKLYEFWQHGATRNQPYESVFTLGMRGQEDTPMTEGENIELLEKIVHDQRQIIGQVFGDKQLADVPQVWCLYKEVQAYYEKGMRVPDDVTLLWADDNWGNLRRLPTEGERARRGGAGVYYHFDYVGGPRSYRWINTVPIAKIWQQMNMAYRFGADKIWIVNVGDLKPMEVPTEFFLRMAWDPDRWDSKRMAEFPRIWAEREFGSKHAENIAELITEYTRHNGRRKPELVDANTYSLLNYQEADRIEASLKSQVAKAEAIFDVLPASQQDAFFQLVLYPVKASATVSLMHMAVAKNRLYAEQGRVGANEYAALAKSYFEQDAQLERQYHQLNNGKWNHFMSQPHIGYTNWNNPEGDQMPVVYDYQAGDYAEMGIALDGYSSAWPANVSNQWPHTSRYELQFDYTGEKSQGITVFNRGNKAFDFSAQSSEPWVKLNINEASVDREERLIVSIDWAALSSGEHSAKISIKGTGWQHASVYISATKPEPSAVENAKGFIEGDGYISINAENFSSSIEKDGIAWQAVEQLGRTDGAITLLPVVDRDFQSPRSAPYVEYPLTFFSSGKVDVQVLLSPVLPFRPNKGLRYAVAIGEEKPQVIDLSAVNSTKGSAWEAMVKDSISIGNSQHNLSQAGPTTLRIYGLDPGLSVQKILINTGKLKPSYLGPPESERKPR